MNAPRALRARHCMVAAAFTAASMASCAAANRSDGRDDASTEERTGADPLCRVIEIAHSDGRALVPYGELVVRAAEDGEYVERDSTGIVAMFARRSDPEVAGRFGPTIRYLADIAEQRASAGDTPPSTFSPPSDEVRRNARELDDALADGLCG